MRNNYLSLRDITLPLRDVTYTYIFCKGFVARERLARTQCLHQHLSKPQDSGDGKIQQHSFGFPRDGQFGSGPVQPSFHTPELSVPGSPSSKCSDMIGVAPSRPLHPATPTGTMGRVVHSCPARTRALTLLDRMLRKD